MILINPSQDISASEGRLVYLIDKRSLTKDLATRLISLIRLKFSVFVFYHVIFTLMYVAKSIVGIRKKIFAN